MEFDPGARRVYRLPASRAWPALVGSALLLAGFVVGISLDENVPAAVPVMVGVAFAAGYAVLVRLVVRSVTTVDDEGLHLRSAFRQRTLRWPDVQAIEIESTAREGSAIPQDRTYVYDTAGVRRELPYVNEVTVGDLPAEVDHLRAVWRERRGTGWSEQPAVSAEIERRRAQWGLPLLGVIGLISGFLIGMAVFVIVLVGGAYPKVGEPEPGFVVGVLLSPVALLVCAPVAGAVTLIVVTLLRRRSRDGRNA